MRRLLVSSGLSCETRAGLSWGLPTTSLPLSSIALGYVLERLQIGSRRCIMEPYVWLTPARATCSADVRMPEVGLRSGVQLEFDGIKVHDLPLC
jgi:hypothetical protein